MPSPLITVDLDAYVANLRRLRVLTDGTPQMAIVKADGYGHGMVQMARAARAGGAEWLGVATPDEAVALRDAGDEGPLLCWLAPPGYDFGPVLARDVEVTASSVRQLGEILAAVPAGSPGPRVQLKIDTGLSRNGATSPNWPELVHRAAQSVQVTGVWSHLACADEPEHPANAAQISAFEAGLAVARAAGIDPMAHLANSAGALYLPQARYDIVRLGIATYGQAPAPHLDTAEALGLRPVMTVTAPLAHVKEIPAGAGVSYGHTYVTDRPRTVGLVPVGYGDGIPRSASNRAQVSVRGRRAPMLGRVCMDQFVVDLTGIEAEVGDEVTLWGADPTAQAWAEAADTINYEIVTRVGGRFGRTYVGAHVGGPR